MTDAWAKLKAATQARIGLARNGHAISTGDLLDFQLSHARARDSVLQTWDAAGAAVRFEARGWKSRVLSSQTSNRAQYLQRPDLGRALSVESESDLRALAAKSRYEIVLAMTDGLSSTAANNHLENFLAVIQPRLHRASFEVSPLLLVPFGRVGLSDAIGNVLGPKILVIMVGERPGLSSTDSLGLYLTYEPANGRSDADRNCISNIRPPQGLAYEHAADKLMYLIQESLRLKLSGVALKENAHPVLRDVDGRPSMTARGYDQK